MMNVIDKAIAAVAAVFGNLFSKSNRQVMQPEVQLEVEADEDMRCLPLDPIVVRYMWPNKSPSDEEIDRDLKMVREMSSKCDIKMQRFVDKMEVNEDEILRLARIRKRTKRQRIKKKLQRRINRMLDTQVRLMDERRKVIRRGMDDVYESKII